MQGREGKGAVYFWVTEDLKQESPATWQELPH